MKPYPSYHITPPQDSFNVYTSAGRVVVENAFGRLKARWRRLLKQCDVDHKFVPKLVAACCTLHNIIETHKVGFNMNWMQDVENAEIIFPQPHSTRATHALNICQIASKINGVDLGLKYSILQNFDPDRTAEINVVNMISF
nr:unnamed protein product [Callosobruchus analis]CAI5851193.1 unnamed protein product [Callosobruchus analis]